ncbi:S9 family peptidase [Sphingomonas sp. AP4-R1]|uniref:alpha/beta hydrolase family protein n=1 Tax=Sphingomonas sp. AP4-R1 TaxID=2735134 RepID=UPI001493A40C|nr:prolyl oligopeptidase family serine peptidase [Sphingomonas sp. AP4-R1]QJU60083.1 S9 family peptidase [Sphingomonas sp. AP4-R1]
MVSRWANLTALWGCIACSVATGLLARPYTVDDLIRTERFGRTLVAPGGRWLIVERLGALDQADPVEELALRTARSSLYRVDLAHPGPAQPMLGPGENKGTIALGFSPQGSRLAIGRLQDDRWQLGVVTLATGAVRWFAVSPDYSSWRATLGWAGEGRLVLIAQPDGRLPWVLGGDRRSQDAQIAAWATMRAGNAPSATMIGSGRYRQETPSPAATRLIALDIATGVQRELATGLLQSIAVAPDGRHVALVAEGAVIPPDPGRLVRPSDDPRHRTLQLIEIGSGHSWAPCGACDVPFDPPLWSPQGRDLLFYARDPDSDWQAGKVRRADVDAKRVTAIDPAFRASVRTADAFYAAVALGWMGRTPVALGHMDPHAPAAWYRLDGRPRALARAMEERAPTLVRTREGVPLLLSRDAAWRLTPSGPRRILGDMPAIGVSPTSIMGGETRSTGSAIFGWRAAQDGRMVVATAAGSLSIAIGGRAFRPLAVSAGQRAVVGTVTDDRGVADLLVLRPGKPPLMAARVNAMLADVEAPPPLSLHHRLPDGRSVTSWLYLPDRAPASRPPPLVVVAYAGSVSGETPPAGWGPGDGSPQTNIAVLRGHGFAVLQPSMPMLPVTDRSYDFAGQIGSAVDAAVATGRVDGQHVGLWGHSFGGYTAATTATETDRFKAIVVSNGIYDPASFRGTFAPQSRLDPGANVGLVTQAGWTETGQAHLGTVPWSDPARYIAHSPVYQAGRIQTPLLIIAGDRDFVSLNQGEMLFSALDRQNKDALLVSYWGENHTLASPANLRDCYARILAWFDTYLGTASGADQPAR